jgi:hypothetical protein
VSVGFQVAELTPAPAVHATVRPAGAALIAAVAIGTKVPTPVEVAGPDAYEMLGSATVSFGAVAVPVVKGVDANSAIQVAGVFPRRSVTVTGPSCPTAVDVPV